MTAPVSPLAVLRRAATDAAITRMHDHDAELAAARVQNALATIAALVEAAELPNANLICFVSGEPGYAQVPAKDWNHLRAALAPFQPTAGDEHGR